MVEVVEELTSRLFKVAKEMEGILQERGSLTSQEYASKIEYLLIKPDHQTVIHPNHIL